MAIKNLQHGKRKVSTQTTTLEIHKGADNLQNVNRRDLTGVSSIKLSFMTAFIIS